MGYEQKHEGRERDMDELRGVSDNLVQHNYELKQLILRYGDGKMKSRLNKLMKKYGGNCHSQPKKRIYVKRTWMKSPGA